ncbi:MAG: relaxase/mobilization nuclease domain-containing protein [Lachnospiraceae bacterium]|nr:relaxase/mobilization nuclease domain-containing protein [Lachnospiraceae bacterium]
MAVTKIKEIRSTLNRAIEYICNPRKTKGGLLIDSFGCVPETAAAEMRITANKGTGIGNRAAYHLIQSFSPDDPLTAEQALEIGKKFASQITDGRYEYVIATHNDRGHLHNHIIFNAVDFVNHRKYHHGNKEKKRMRDISDKLCYENNLSVIEETSGRKGKNYEEYQQSKAGTSWKERLADLIDKAISESASFDEFLEKIELEGVEIKRGKHISFRCGLLGQERMTRGKQIGEGYTEDAIRARIDHDETYLSEHHLNLNLKQNATERKADIRSETDPAQNEKTKATENRPTVQKPIWKKNTLNSSFKNKNINLLVKTSEIQKARDSRAYANAVDRGNISSLVKSMNFLSAHNLQTSDDLVIFEDGVRSALHIEERNLETINEELARLHEKIKFTQNYKKNISVYIDYRRGGSDPAFYNNRRDEIDSYQLAKLYFDKKGIVPKELKLNELFDQYRALKSEKEACQKSVTAQKSLLRDTVTVRKNYETVLNVKLSESIDNAENDSRQKNKKRDEREI